MVSGKTVLLVEDNPSVLQLMERALAREGYQILTASNGEEALQMTIEEDRHIDLLVADLVLPRVGGLELAWRLTDWDAALRIILISGYAAEEAALSTMDATRVRFIEKPFTAQSFKAGVRELLGDHSD